MDNIVSFCWQYLRAFILIYLCLWLGNGLAILFTITIPGSIIGMLILFALLSSQILPAHWVKPGCQLFTRYMTLLFVPVSVGVMQYYEQLRNQLGALVVSCVISTLIVMIVVSYTTQYLHRERKIISSRDNHEEKR